MIIRQWGWIVLILILVFIGLLLFGPAPIKEKCRNVVDGTVAFFVNEDPKVGDPDEFYKTFSGEALKK